MISASGVGSGRGAQGLGNRGEDSAGTHGFGSKQDDFSSSGLLFYLVAALFGEGFIHPDEHFQIFCKRAAQTVPLADLP